MPRTAAYWIETLGLQPHPEGGFFRESYRASEQAGRLPKRFGGERALSTAIYFLVTPDGFSAFHRLRADEGWHFYDGAPLLLHRLRAGGLYEVVRLGLDEGAWPQTIVPAGDWFAAETTGACTLVGCTVAPGFDFADFELAERDALTRHFPQHSALIERLTR